MATRKSTRRKAKTSPSVPVEPITATAAADVSTATPAQDLRDRLFAISCRVAVYAHATEHLNDDEAPHAEKESAGALPVALGEVHRNLMEIVDQLGYLEPEARS